ncbi:uncharacterized protein [Montipora capricornis]|uniref:uncharacterized protein n=1 Tax=Montipora capricornis TaxID=246305 RepID=UPI0035F12046
MELYRNIHWCKVVLFISLLHSVWGDCIDWDLGMENSLIPDERITASSAFTGDPAHFGRLNDVRGAWCTSWNLFIPNPYLQIDLQSAHIICAVSTQGSKTNDYWVKRYTLQSSTDNKTWADYKENGHVRIFLGNNDRNTAKKNVLNNVLIARWLRFVVSESTFWRCMRTEVYGVKHKPENIVTGKRTTQSSIYSDNYSNGTSDKAVDGNPDQKFNNGYCSRTLEDNPSWWRVDLGYPVQVFEVRIVIGNLHLSEGSNVTNNHVYKITLGDSFSVTNNSICARWDGLFELETSLVCHMNPPRSGRYVGILTSRKQFLQLCEVDIFSKGNLAFRKPAESKIITFSPEDGNLEPWSRVLWWQVDLGRMVPVTEVYYYVHSFGVYVVVRVASKFTEVGQECRSRVGDRISRFHILCWPSVLGRYVTLGDSKSSFELIEVEVYSAQRGCQIQAVGWFIVGSSPDDVFLASSSKDGNGPGKSRLNGNGAWLPSTNRNASDFLQMDLGYEFFICAIATQGNPAADQWTTKYKIHTSLDNISWMIYKENGKEKVFHGNTARSDIVKHNLEEVIIASFIRFQPTDFFGHKAFRVELYGVLKSPVPVEAPMVNVTAQSSTSIAAFWELPKRYTKDKDILSFKLLYQSRTPLRSDRKNTLTVKKKGFSTVVTGLEKFTEYEFKVWAFSSVADGPKSSSKVARTLEDVPSKAPSKFTVTANTSTIIIASWQLPSPDSRHGIIRGFKLFLRKKGSDNRPETMLIPNTSMYTIPATGLEKFTEYEFQVLAYTSVGDGPNSSVQFATTKEDIPSKAPSEFMVTASTSTSVKASWQLPPTGSRNGIIRGFKLFYRKKNSDNQPKLFHISNASIRAETMKELMKFTEYEFQVLAYTSLGDGPKSSFLFAKTMEDAPSKPPTGFIVSAATSTSVTASWKLPPVHSRNGIIKGFKLFINKKGSSDKPDLQLIDVSNASVYTKTVTGLQESTKYELQVLAHTSAGDGPKSFVQFVKTKGSDIRGPGFSIASLLKVSFSIGGLSLLAFLLFIGITFCKKRRKRPTKWTAKDIKVLNSCEIPPLRIELLEELGQGAFGKVHKAKLIDGLEYFANTPGRSKKNCKVKIVAIKQLHENAMEAQKLEFLDEIELMKVVGKHQNVLSFVGCWTTITPLRLIIEYIPHGDLLHWLRAKRSQIRSSFLGAAFITEGNKQYTGTKECNTATLVQGGEAGEIYSPSTSTKDHKETITSSSNGCVVPLIAISCPNTSGEGQQKALTSDNHDFTMPLLSQECDETITSGNSKSRLPLTRTAPAFAGDDEEDLIVDKNNESSIPLVSCSSTYPVGNEENIIDDTNAIPLVFLSSASNKEDALTENTGDECDEDCESFAPLDLIKLAWQIARGMTYLSQKGLVHRDLAARNILVGHGKKVKIGDFGLMRQLYHEVYETNNQKKVPVKWMAPESIFEEIFTTKSDVWSYGVVLWEIATLGGSPYAMLNHKQLLESLKRGYRLEKPDMCTNHVYALMTDCWNQDPDERPSFQRLYRRLDDMLDEQEDYFDFGKKDESKYYYRTQESKTAEVDELDNLDVVHLPHVIIGSNEAEADEPVKIQVEKPQDVSKASLII